MACGMKQIKPQYNCSLELAMELVGGKWKLVLLWHLLSGTKRFSEIKRKLGDITQKMLTLQLRELETARAAYPDGLSGHPAPCGIFVDGEGDGARPVLRGLCAWSGKYAVEKGITLAPLPPSRDGKDLPGAAESFPEA